jgi:hypothetical protein
MAGRLQRRLERLKAKQPKPKDKYFFDPWATDREHWAAVPAAEKERLWQVYQKTGPFAGPCITRRKADGSWFVVIFNTKFGGCEHRVMSTVQEMGVEAFLSWAAGELSPDELEVLASVLLSHWNPEDLQDGDVEVLSGITQRLPKTRPVTGG